MDNRRFRRTAVAIVATLAVLLLTCLVASPFSVINVGSPFGYYGDLNRTKWRIDAIEGVDVIDVKANYDITVEEMYFEVLIDDTHRARIFISKGSIWRRFAEVSLWEQRELPLIRKSAGGTDETKSQPE